MPERVPESEPLSESRLPGEGRAWGPNDLEFEGTGVSGSCFVLVLKTVGTLKDGRRPSSSQLRILSPPLSFMGQPALALRGHSCLFSPGRTLFLSGHKPGSFSGKCVRVGYHCQLDTT